MPERRKKLLILVAENLIEFGKLSFAGFVIGGVLSESPNKFMIITIGAVCSVAPVLIGILALTFLEED
ncbi:MAG: hypothetical protein LBB79_03150 [Prevotellaceae bacterium]|jgi:hypothetical protein|nr:hypothetical protein [Prevotellaceae bacterium]